MRAIPRRGASNRTCGLIATAMLAYACACALAGPARAGTVEVGCGQLQEKMDAVAGLANHGKGETIVLNGLCEAANLKKTSGLTIPGGADFTLEGKPGTTSGLDGEGVKGSMLQSEPGHEVGSLTLANLVFEHADVTTPVASALTLIASQLTLSGDTFSGDTDTEGQGGAVDVEISPDNCVPAGSTALAITDSAFRDDKLVATSESGEGGALWVQQNCPAANSVLQGDVFEGNTLEGGASSLRDTGGAVWMVTNASEAVSALRQSADVFASNRIVASGGKANYGGGGEWLEGISLTSVDDRYSGNSIPGATGAGRWSWGAGLGLLNSGCNPKTATESTLENAVVAGNSIAAGEAADLGGAGIYVGCAESENTPNHLKLQDSTVTENTVASGGVAGIDGGPSDQLVLQNSIVADDLGGSETGGFAGTGGSLSASHSDVCAPGSTTTALPGEGNICANPLLADDGKPESFDVHETSASPTIDAGSNALVPEGLGSDFYGDPRIAAATLNDSCGDGGPFPGPAVVDIGADEAPTGTRVTIPACAPGPCAPVSSFALPGVAQRPNGVEALSFTNLAAGKLSILATFRVMKTVVEHVHGHTRKVKKLVTIVYGRAGRTTTSPGDVTIALKPTKQALALLRARKRLRVLLTITFTAAGATPTTHTKTILVRYVKPAPKPHRHG
ncbi:MAG TPA: hypothetical protein VGY13_11620 [Solirubrobacteraceae bacterium]|nr:hypothetical protein [Solirubrobacteraceae bacterium]